MFTSNLVTVGVQVGHIDVAGTIQGDAGGVGKPGQRYLGGWGAGRVVAGTMRTR